MSDFGKKMKMVRTLVYTNITLCGSGESHRDPDERGPMNKAFLGANGWYVAYERPDGFHYQSDGTMTRDEAENEARRRNDDHHDMDSEWAGE